MNAISSKSHHISLKIRGVTNSRRGEKLSRRAISMMECEGEISIEDAPPVSNRLCGNIWVFQ